VTGESATKASFVAPGVTKDALVAPNPRRSRLVRAPTVLNMRDLGGLRTRTGRTRTGVLYRAGSFTGISPPDAEWLVRATGLRTLIDLRTPREVVRDGKPERLIALGVEWEHVPFGVPGRFLDGQPDRGRLADFLGEYRRLTDVAAAPVRAVLEAVAARRYPLVFACTLGKDRTGVVAALVLSALGVRPREIIRDYALTARSLRHRTGLVAELAARKHIPPREMAGRLEARAATMRILLGSLTHHPGPDAGLVAAARAELVGQ
jgi:protein-tyrosine phosphatase